MTTDAAKQPKWEVGRRQQSRARTLRRNSTDAEQLIWSTLRGHRLNGVSFRRQTPLGPYIADFVCHASKLVIEIDGGQRFENEHRKRDARRDAFFASKGFTVLRFNNHDVLTNRQGVLETIASAIAHAPSPTLPRLRGREHTAEAAR